MVPPSLDATRVQRRKYALTTSQFSSWQCTPSNIIAKQKVLGIVLDTVKKKKNTLVIIKTRSSYLKT